MAGLGMEFAIAASANCLQKSFRLLPEFMNLPSYWRSYIILWTSCPQGYNCAPPRQDNSSRESERSIMLGELISETKGKRLVRRVISIDPPTAEVSFEDKGQIMGVATTGMGSYTSVVRSDGSILGHGQGMSLTDEGE